MIFILFFYTKERPTAAPIARFTSISICASACAIDPTSAAAYEAFAASKLELTAFGSISSKRTASGHVTSCREVDRKKQMKL